MLLRSLYYIESAISGIIGYWEFPEALVIKNLPANAGDKRDMDLIPGQEDSLEKKLVTHSCILAGKIP